MKRKIPIAVLNTFSSLLLQVVSIISGFIIPKLILNTFGSETNGLVSSITQFLNYINLIEGGLNGVVLASFYKPLADKDSAKISSVFVTARNFLRKIAFIFIAYSIVLSVCYPLFTHSSFDFGFVSSLVLILSIKLFAQYCFSLANKNLLDASKHGYVAYLTHSALIIAETILTILVVKIYPNIHILKLASALLYLIQPMVYARAVKKRFNLDAHAEPDTQLIKDRWNGLAINIAAFIHNNTDITLLTIMTSLETVSVYAVYALVARGLSQLVKAISGAIAPSIGNLYAKGDEKKLNKKYDLFEYAIFLVSFFLFGIGILLVTPFVMIYTKGVTDANYYQPLFGIILLSAELFSVLRGPALRLGYGAGKFKDMRKVAFIEAGANIIISITLIPFLDITGVAIGTLIAMAYRSIWQNYYLRNHLINRPFSKFFKRFLLFFIPTTIIIVACWFLLPFTEYSVLYWLLHASCYALIFILVFGVISLLFFRKDLKTLLNYLSKGKHRQMAS